MLTQQSHIFCHISIIYITLLARFLNRIEVNKQGICRNHIKHDPLFFQPEGFPLFYLVIISISFYAASQSRVKMIKYIPIVVMGIFLVMTGYKMYKALMNTTQTANIDLRAHINVLNYLYAQNKNQPFCVRIYTPPVIPYTYNYSFNYYQRVKKYPAVSTEYVNHKCWYIVEQEQDSDGYKARITQWRSENISSKARLVRTKIMDSGTQVEHWEEK